MIRGPYAQSVLDRFEAKVDRSDADGCWLWTASVDRKGYGQLQVVHAGVKRPRKAHRLSWEMHHETELGPGQCVLHHCDTPACVRPDHLFVGTVHDNNTDMAMKGRQWKQARSHCINGHPYEGHTLMRNGRLTRVCAICRRASRRRWEQGAAA